MPDGASASVARRPDRVFISDNLAAVAVVRS